MVMRILITPLIGMLLLLASAPQPVVAQRSDWEIVPGVLLTYSASNWRVDAATNQLQSIVAPGCALSPNIGRGIPEDWKWRVLRISRGGRQIVRTTYYDGQWRLQFVTYRYTRPTNLEYLNSEGVLLKPPTDIRQSWRYCQRAAESVLATARRVGS